MTKVLIFDSGPLINLSMDGLLDIIPKLKEKFDGKFIVTSDVKYEVVDRPMGIPRFELGALTIGNLIEKGILELPSSLGIDEAELKQHTQQLMDMANHYLQIKGKWVSIVSAGEMSCLALSTELKKKGIDSVIAIDERTTRILGEEPANLGRLMSDKMHTHATLVAQDFTIFSNHKFIRSSELVFVAYKKGLIPIEGKKALEALLYATKYHGAAITFEEIEELKRM